MPGVGEELGRIPDPLQQPRELIAIDNRQHVARRPFRIVGEAALPDQVAAVLDEPVDVAREHRNGRRLFLDHFDGEQRNQADQRTDLELVEAAVGIAQHVVEESVLFVPELIVAAAHVLHRAADVDEVLEELRRQRLVDAGSRWPAPARCASCTARTNAIQPVASDCSSMAPSAKRFAAVDDGDVVEAQKSAFEDVQCPGGRPCSPTRRS